MKIKGFPSIGGMNGNRLTPSKLFYVLVIMSALATSCDSKKEGKGDGNASGKPNSGWTGKDTGLGTGGKEDIKITGEPTMGGETGIKNDGELVKPQENNIGGTINPETQERFIYPPLGINPKKISSKYSGFLHGGSYILEKTLYRLGTYESNEKTAYFKSPNFGKLLVTSLKDGTTNIVTLKYQAPKQQGQLGSPQTQTITVEGNIRNIYSIKVQLDSDVTGIDFNSWVQEIISNLMTPENQQNTITDF